MDRRSPEDLSIEELETLLAHKRREARATRLEQFRQSGRALPIDPVQLVQKPAPIAAAAEEGSSAEDEVMTWRKRAGRFINRALLFVEIGAVVGLVAVVLFGAQALQRINQEAAQALNLGEPTPTPLIMAVVLPSGHTPPNSADGARPNDAEIPESLRPIVQSMPSVAIPTTGPEQARSINIPAIWNSPAPVVQGDGWEQLKRGVGQHIGTANPGEAGNLVLSAHNDIFGELFRDLDQLSPGDDIIVNTASRQFVYRVTGMRIVEPTDVEVMQSSDRSTITLISCYPYLVDTQRIVVFGELVSQ